jgi:folylpolyglutamate synthase/dihydropteroate synthase
LALLLRLNEARGLNADLNGIHPESLRTPPARFERWQHSQIYLDGAHNPQACARLKQTIDHVFGDDYDLAFGCLANRPFEEMANMLRSSHNNYWIEFSGHGPVTPRSTLDKAASSWGGVVTHPQGLVHQIRHNSQCRPLVVTGSLYLCGAIGHELMRGVA